MAIQKTDGILLRRRNLRESSIILTFYTKDFGKISGVIKGARGPRAQMGTSPHLFSLDRIVFYESKRRKLSVISQCDLKDFFDPIRKDLERSVYAKYFLELVDSLCGELDKNEKLFELLLDSLEFLCTEASAKRAARIFEIRLLDQLGLMPELKNCANCGVGMDSSAKLKFSVRQGGVICSKCTGTDRGAVWISRGTVNFITHIKTSPYHRASRVKVSKDLGMELESILRKFVDYHSPSRLKTVEFMKKINL